MTGRAGIGLLIVFWALASMGGGALLALLARRMHPALSLRKLWLFYTGLLAFTVAAVMAIAWR